MTKICNICKNKEFTKQIINKDEEFICYYTCTICGTDFEKRYNSLDCLCKENPDTIKQIKNSKERLAFYQTKEWKQVSKEFKQDKILKCEFCGRSDLKICVDHIKPIKEYWDLRFDINNLQLLCEICNKNKLNFKDDDIKWKESAINEHMDIITREIIPRLQVIKILIRRNIKLNDIPTDSIELIFNEYMSNIKSKIQ